MAVHNFTGTIQMRQDTAANWRLKNPILKSGEIGYDITNKLSKIGDGITAWIGLNYVSALPINYNLEATSWAKIAELSAAGIARAVFKIGEEKTVTLSTNEQITLVILGFDHDDLTAGGKAGLTFGMKNLFATKYPMNSQNTNIGGWNSSRMRVTTLPNILTQLPLDLQSAIKAVDKKTTPDATSIVTSSDKLFLFSNVEVKSSTGYLRLEGMQYEYWRTVKNSTVLADSIKYLSNGAGAASHWWLRSAIENASAYFSLIMATGESGTNTAINMAGICFGFCI